MAAGEPRSLEHPDAGPQDPESRPRASSSSHARDRVAMGMVIPEIVSKDGLPTFVEIVKVDLSREWLQGRPVNVESYLESFPELGTVETVPAELILAEYEARSRVGESVDLAQFEQRFPHQAEELRKLIDQQTGEPATGSMLGQLSEMTVRAHRVPLSPARDPKSAPALPRRFGRYHILELLGQGAMGTVYLVRDTTLHRQVALKVPHVRSGDAHGPTDRRVLDRFHREAHAAAILHHPNLCPVYDVGQIDGVPYLTMAYIRGRPLSQFIDQNRPLDPQWVAVLVRKLALALQAAHDKGVIHRDLKPANVMICEDDEPTIMDFGLAWRLDLHDSDERLTRVGLVLGTPAYMSPEQLSGRVEDIGPGCDIYSLGVIVYELLTGRCPFEGPEAVVLGQVLFVEPEQPSKNRPDVDSQLETICLKAMAKRDDKRYSTMNELADALGVYLHLRTTAPKPLPPAVEPVEPVKFVEPVTPVESVEPVESVTSVRSVRSVRSVTPVEPVESASNDLQRYEAEATDEVDRCRDALQSKGRLAGQVSESPVPELAAAGLLQSWHQWTETVATFALGKRSRRYRNPRTFASLREQLLATLRAGAAKVDGPERDFYLALERLISPWVSLRCLAREDREILGHLLSCSQNVERMLQPPDAEAAVGVWPAAVALGLLLALALLVWGMVIR